MNPKYTEFVNALKAKPQELDVNVGVFDEIAIDAKQLGDRIDDLKRSLFYGAPMKNGENITDRSIGKLHITNQQHIDIIHATIGILGEACEMFERLHQDESVMDGQLDKPNWVEEAGDLDWYITLLMQALGVDLDTVLRANVGKLQKRFPNGFNYGDVINRDVAAEREVIEAALK